jgi:phage shock protein A
MRLFDRLTRLVKADAHGLLDALEERSLLARQELREAELDLLRKRAHVRALAEAEERSREEHARLTDSAAALDAEAALAVASGRDDLARFALRRVLAERRRLALVDAQRADLGQARERLAALLEEQERAFEALRTRVRARLARERVAGQEACADGARGDVDPAEIVTDEEVELELLRRRAGAAREGRA